MSMAGDEKVITPSCMFFLQSNLDSLQRGTSYALSLKYALASVSQF